VIATAPNTRLTYDPPQPGAPTMIANAGDFVELPDITTSFMIIADQKILVAQYMEGSDTRAGLNDITGDPAMTLAVPVAEFRTSYLVHAPTNYIGSFIDVVAPIDAEVMLDGTPMTLDPIPSTDYAIGRKWWFAKSSPDPTGNHTLTGNMPFGVTVYGYAPYTSYWYPGGLELREVQ
jgi:hypothetical protein